MKPLLRFLIAAILLCVPLWGVLLDGRGLVCVAHQDEHLIHTGQLMGTDRVGQVFFCDRENLARIETRMGTYGSWSDSEIQFALVEMAGPLPQGPRARLAPRDGGLIRLEEDWAITTLVGDSRPGANGLEVLVSRPRNADQGELVAAIMPWNYDQLDLPRPLVFRLPMRELPLHGPVRFKIPPEYLSLPRPLMVAMRVEGVGPGGYLGLHWRPFPAVHLPQVLEKPSRFWKAFTLSYLGEGGQKGNRIFPGWLIASLTYPPQAPLGPPLRFRAQKATWVSDNSFHPVSFEPVPDSRNRFYHFFYQAPQATLSNALTLWTHRRAGEKSFLTENGTLVDGALCFRAYARVPRKEAMNLFTAKLNEGKTGSWLSGRMIVPAVLIQILIMAGILSYLIGRGRSRDEDIPER